MKLIPERRTEENPVKEETGQKKQPTRSASNGLTSARLICIALGIRGPFTHAAVHGGISGAFNTRLRTKRAVTHCNARVDNAIFHLVLGFSQLHCMIG
jgi:hypothetical protein